MSGRIQKKIRKVANKRYLAMIGAIKRLPLRQRTWFSWKTLRGV